MPGSERSVNYYTRGSFNASFSATIYWANLRFDQTAHSPTSRHTGQLAAKSRSFSFPSESPRADDVFMLPEGILNACTLPLFVHYTGRAVRLQTDTVSDPQAMVVALRYFKLESWREGQLGFQRMGKWGYWGGCWTSRRANVNANERGK